MSRKHLFLFGVFANSSFKWARHTSLIIGVLVSILLGGCLTNTDYAASRPEGVEIDIESIKSGVSHNRLKKHEMVWERVRWVRDFDTALALSNKHERPIFLFSMHGQLDGRC